ncbi:MAG: ROK family protein [Lachnospiraceae bacterium]
MILGALEAGGTKMVCAIGDENGNIIEQIRIPTLEPEETMKKIVEYFAGKNIQALGVAAFGPVGINPGTENYGKILETTKTMWRHFDLLGSLKPLEVPVNIDTDVAGSCLGEVWKGAAQGLDNVVYVTVGTGIGAGIMVNGKMIHGMLHPEAGHVLISRKANDCCESVCAYHNNCVEGLASGTAIKAHWGKPADELLGSEQVWELEADYIAQALVNYIMTVSPQKIILGGGVMHVGKLFPLIRKKTKEYLNGYLITKELDDMDSYIVPAGLGDDQGIVGCLKLAADALAGN